MPPTSTQNDMSVFPAQSQRGKDAVPRTMYPPGAIFTNSSPFDLCSTNVSSTSPQWDNFQDGLGPFSHCSSTPSLTPIDAAFHSGGFTEGMQTNTMPRNTGYTGVVDNEMFAAAQSLSTFGSMFGADGGFQPATNPFFFCSDFQSSLASGFYQNGVAGSYHEMQPQFQQQQLLYRTQQLNSAMMLQRYWGGELPPQLKPSCPDEDRHLFTLCWEHRFQEETQMWDFVGNEFKMLFNKTYTRDELQEKLVRCRAKYIEWLPQDKEILRKAWMRIEENRYQSLLEHFYALGGSRNMMLSASDIQYKVVNEMGLEDGLYVEEKAKKKAKRRVGCQNCPSCAESGEDSTIVWCDRYAGTAQM